MIGLNKKKDDFNGVMKLKTKQNIEAKDGCIHFRSMSSAMGQKRET